MSGGAPKTTTQTVTQKNEPWDAAKPFYESLYGEAQTAFANTNRQPYTGDLYAGPNPTQKAALDLYRQQAPGAAAGVDDFRKMAADTAAGKYLDLGSNPYFGAAASAAIEPITLNLERRILPQLQDQSVLQGAYGGSGYGTAQALALSDWSRASGDITAKMALDAYMQERQNQMAAGNALQQATALSLQPAQILDTAGSQEQSWAQAALDAALQRYNINQAAPWAGLGEWAQILNGGGFSSVAQTQPVRSPSAFGSFLQGATGTAALANAFFPGATRAAGNWVADLFGGGSGPGAGASAQDFASWAGW